MIMLMRCMTSNRVEFRPVPADQPKSQRSQRSGLRHFGMHYEFSAVCDYPVETELAVGKDYVFALVLRPVDVSGATGGGGK